jgi:hypothetical protein
MVSSGMLPCGSCKNGRFEGTSVLTIATWRNIPEDTILQNEYKLQLQRRYLNAIRRQVVDIQGGLHPDGENFGHFLGWFQCPQLS